MIIGVIFSVDVFSAAKGLKNKIAEDNGKITEIFAGFVRVTWQLLVLISSIMVLSAGTHNPFIYYRF